MEQNQLMPLPERQFTRYILIFSLITLISLGGSIVYVLWKAKLSLTWQEWVVVSGLLAQIGLYFWMGFAGRDQGLTNRKLAVFFGGSLAIWVVEYWLYPDIFWVMYLYIGQMFGMLPLKIALPVSALLGVFMSGSMINWNITVENRQEFIASTISFGFILLFLTYINQLGRTSQERAQLIKELESAQKELEAAQQQVTELAVLRERERLARDLHDSLGHALVAISVQLEAIQRLYKVDALQASRQVDELKTLTRASMEDLRRSIAGLRAPGLGGRSLSQALQVDCVEFGERSGVEVECLVDPRLDELRPVIAETIWRAVQEALTNVEKHAQAGKVMVRAAPEHQEVNLRIADDGIGLPPDAENQPDCFGLRGMRERVEALGGSLKINGSDDGTLIEVLLPCETDEPVNKS